METHRLPDGRWATSPIYVGMAPTPQICPASEHDWEVKSKIPIEGGSAHNELCRKCKFCRLVQAPPEASEGA